MVDVGGIPMIATGGGYGGCDGGFGGGSGIWAILLLALLGGRGFGRDGFDGGGHHFENNNHTAEKELEFINTTMNSRFNETNNAIDRNANATFQQSIFKEICDTTENINNNISALGAQTAQGFFNTAIGLKDAEIEAIECCA